MCEDTKLTGFEGTWNVGDYLVEQERLNDRRARWQFDLLLWRLQFDFVVNAMFADTSSDHGFHQRRWKLRRPHLRKRLRRLFETATTATLGKLTVEQRR